MGGKMKKCSHPKEKIRGSGAAYYPVSMEGDEPFYVKEITKYCLCGKEITVKYKKSQKVTREEA